VTRRASPRGVAPDFTAAARALRRGQLVVDRVFDEVFPSSVRRASSVHWTPVEVAMRGARLLAAKPNATILDLGAGVGKFCIVAAAALAGARVRGVEHRSHFVAIARDAARKAGVVVDFALGTIDAEDPANVDGIYLFNPFAENLTAPEDRLDESVELSEERFWRDIESTERLLRAARPGTRVVTYCGWGGAMPPGYRLALREGRCGTLELWVKSGHPGVRENAPASAAVPIGTTTLRALRKRAIADG
jgi:SAM-dependent methyltransferase